MDRIAIIDGNSLINRAYYAIKNPMITKEGIYTHAIFGFINMLEKIRGDYGPDYMAVAFDLPAPTFRHMEYSDYKAGRKKMPVELAMQIPLLKDILDAMRICRVEMEGFEADDIIGTIARMTESEGFQPIIVTGDRDQLQLATDITKIVYTKRGVSDFDLYDHDSFVEKYGFTPLQFIDFKGLSGDSSDNIPGVAGVGPKTATKLINQFGSVEEIIAHADQISPAGLQKKISENTQQAMMSKMLATINTKVPIEQGMDDFLLKEPDYDRLIEIYRKLEFNRFLKRLKVSDTDSHMADDQSGKFPSADGDEENRMEDISRFIIKHPNELSDIKLKGETFLHVFGDCSHLSDPEITGIAVLNSDSYYYVDLQGGSDGMKAAFKDWMSVQDIALGGHNLKNDYYMLMALGIRSFDTSFDTAIAQYVLDSGRSGYSLTALSNEYLHTSIEDEEDFISSGGQIDMFTDQASLYSGYGIEFCHRVMRISKIQAELIERENLEKVLYEVELPLIEVMAAMEHEGFRADRAYLEEFGAVLSKEIDDIAESIHEMSDAEFNINSPVQLGEVLFEKLGLPHGKKTKRGYSTSADVLEKLKDKHPIVPAILEYRSLSKLKSTYIDGLIPLINKTDGKIHAHFQQTVTTTGRISCTEPNLQNIPIRQELGRKLRKAFVPDGDGCSLTGADYSQIELRVLAHMSEDTSLTEAFNNGEDIHRATAANVLGIPEDKITLEERSRAKAVNFGVIYGMSSFGLSSELHISRKDADEYIEAYFSKHQKVKEFMDNSVSFCREKGYVYTLMGRKRFIKEINAPQYMVRQIGERLAMNSPIQGTAADIIKLSMIKVFRALKDKKLKSKLILQIHDELIINTYPDEREEVRSLLAENMESAVELNVELKAEINEGTNWYELK